MKVLWSEQKEEWNATNDVEIIIAANTQTSKDHIGTVRKWTCPADGAYIIEYNFKQVAENNNQDKERLSHFVLRRNHRIIEKDIYDQRSGTLAGSHEIDIILEAGEVMSFEFYNGSEYTTETIEITISIEKLS